MVSSPFVQEPCMRMISTRKNFTDPDTSSERNLFSWVCPHGNLFRAYPFFTYEQEINDLSGRDVIVLVHGFDNSWSDVVKTYYQMLKHLKESYTVVGYVWPCSYSNTKQEKFSTLSKGTAMALETSRRFRGTVKQIAKVAKTVDVMPSRNWRLIDAGIAIPKDKDSQKSDSFLTKQQVKSPRLRVQRLHTLRVS